ncbi:MAG: carboxypeptidase regulatory-like domain-containing protein, partial [Chloroflexi bacterium]|nr:carboxypeptidase regulatory-like domain-containing protein [Chloroflexota bacterium]
NPPPDNVYGGGDNPIAGATVTITTTSGTVTPLSVTPIDATGLITFTVPPIDNTTPYWLNVTPPAGYNASPGNTGAREVTPNPASGQTVGPFAFGYFRNGTVRGDVWYDSNGNGLREAGEPPLAGVQVTLYSDDDDNPANGQTTVAGPITTLDGGVYQFGDVAPNGTGVRYRLGFVLPAGYAFTVQGSPITTDDNSDPDAVTGFTARFDVAYGQTVSFVDAGAIGTLTLTGTSWEDTDADGVFDTPGEVGLPGVTLTLTVTSSINSTAPVLTFTAASSGTGVPNFTFSQLPPGSYQVSATSRPVGYLLSTPGTRSGATLPASNQNFGLYRTAAVGDRVWLDVNGNQTYQAAVDIGFPGVTIRLRNAVTDAVVATTTSAASGDIGSYRFENVTPGAYRVEFVVPPGVQPVNDGLGLIATDNDNDVRLTGRTADFTLASDQIITSVDAGLAGAGGISGIAWLDENFDNVRNLEETRRIQGVQVTLVLTPTGLAAPLTFNAVTAADGSYSFTSLPPGSYQVTFARPDGYFDVTPRFGADPSVDSDAPVASGTLSAGQSLTTLDAGYRRQVRVFLPIVLTPAPQPDLTVSFTLTPDKPSYDPGEPVLISVNVTNSGNLTTTIGFWVDLYINPSTPPAGPNVRWDQVCGIQPCYGIAWYVDRALGPGETITLTSAPGAFAGPQSRWPGSFAGGTRDLYVFVDSYNPPVPTGAVVESNESNNRAERLGLNVRFAGTAATPAGETAPPVALPPRPLPAPVGPQRQ